jgi:hypothetical protein
MSRAAPAGLEQPNPTAVKAIAALVGILGLGVLIQAATGGLVARETGRKGFVDAHSGLAYLIALLAVATVVVAVVMWRGKAGGQVVLYETIALLVAVVIQIGIGQKIGDLEQSTGGGMVGKSGSHAGLLAIHIPLALIIFGLALHLSMFVANVRRSGGS